MKKFTLLTVLFISLCLRGDDPKLLAKDFADMAREVANIGGDTTFSSFQVKQQKALSFYNDFLLKHPESVYSNKVRWAIYSAYLTLNRKHEAGQVLVEIQDTLLQDLLKVSYAQMELGETKGASQILKGILENSEDGGVRARIAQFLWVTRNKQAALNLVDEVIGNSKYSKENRAKALLIKADFFRGMDERIPILEKLVNSYPGTKSADEGEIKLAAARLTKGSDALPFTITTSKNKQLSLDSLKGKAVLLYFWATYSYPSWAKIKELKTAVNKIGPGNMTVIAVACESYVDRPKNFLAAQGLNWDLLAEGNKWHNTLATLYDIRTLPSFVLIDRHGKIVNSGPLEIEDIIKLFPEATKA